MYYKDTAGNMDSLDFEHADAVNQGLSVRRHMTRQSRVIDIMGRIHGDIFFQERYMFNEVNVKLKLVRSKNAFCLVGDADNYKAKIMHASLFVRKVKVKPWVFLAHAKALERGTNGKVFDTSCGLQVVHDSSKLSGC